MSNGSKCYLYIFVIVSCQIGQPFLVYCIECLSSNDLHIENREKVDVER